MRKSLFGIFFTLIVSNLLFSQNTATDFTTEDCNGIMHNLYDSLDAGNIIVIAWVMPCGPCSTYAYPAYSAVQSFNTSHPEKIDFYLVDDYANTNCVSLVNWGNSNNMPLNTTFSSSVISMSDYGSNGMPKVVVLGGADYNVYYNQNDDKINFTGVQVAINNALSNVTNVNEIRQDDFDLFVYPNPSRDRFNISFTSETVQDLRVRVLNTVGEEIVSEELQQLVGQYTKKINLKDNSKGIYFLEIETNDGIINKKLTLQ